MLEVLHNDISVLLENGQSNEEVETTGQVIRPQDLPEVQHVQPRELALVPDEQHAEEEEEVGGISALEVQVKFWVHELDEVVEREKLFTHAALVTEKVPLHAIHEVLEAPEGDGVVLHHGVDGRQQVGHALHVPEVAVVLIVG